MTFGERLKYLRENKKLTQEELGRAFNVGKSSVSQWENNIRIPRYKKVAKLAEFFGVKVDYLIGNESLGDKLQNRRKNMGMSREELANNIQETLYNIVAWENDEKIPNDDQLLSLCMELSVPLENLTIGLEASRHSKEQSIQKIKTIPILKSIVVGSISNNDNWLQEIEIPNNLSADFAIIVNDNSMNAIGLYPGDTILFKKSDDYKIGCIMAIGISDEKETFVPITRFVLKKDNVLSIKSMNFEFPEETLTEKHQVLGYAVLAFKELPKWKEVQKMQRNISEENWAGLIDYAKEKDISPTFLLEVIKFHLKFNIRAEK